jgi:hypothetical protein
MQANPTTFISEQSQLKAWLETYNKEKSLIHAARDDSHDVRCIFHTNTVIPN